MTQVTTKFLGENVLDSTNAFELLITTVMTDEADLKGLPPSAIAGAPRERSRKATLKAGDPRRRLPDYLAVMTYMDNAATRRHFYLTYAVRATEEGRNNRPLIGRILELRREKARLLGFADFADLVLEDRMAHNGALLRPGFPWKTWKAKTERRFREENSKRAAGMPAAPSRGRRRWNSSHGTWRITPRNSAAALYDFDEETLRRYFPLEKVVAGMFDLVHRLYGIRVTEEKGVPTWDPQVCYYNVHDEAGKIHRRILR